MKRKVGDYSNYVQHPRYGRGPRFTDVCPKGVLPGYRLSTYQSDTTIGGTAVEADLERQSFSPVPVLYYFDLKRECVDCGRPFIFFAEEQKYWYETLGFALDSKCVRCIDCRNRQHGLERQRRRYEELYHCKDRTIDEDIEMAECAVSLVEHGIFHTRQTEHIRMLLNRIAGDNSVGRRYNHLRNRVLRIEGANDGGQTDERQPE